MAIKRLSGRWSSIDLCKKVFSCRRWRRRPRLAIYSSSLLHMRDVRDDGYCAVAQCNADRWSGETMSVILYCTRYGQLRSCWSIYLDVGTLWKPLCDCITFISWCSPNDWQLIRRTNRTYIPQLTTIHSRFQHVLIALWTLSEGTDYLYFASVFLYF